MKSIRILGVHIPEREKTSEEVQEILTRYGCSIRTRLGLNVSDDDNNDLGGLLILELSGSEAEMERLQAKLTETEGVQVREMSFPV